MPAVDMPSTLYVAALFLGYLLLWATKRRQMMRALSTDPNVMARSESSLQRYLALVMRIMTLSALALIVVHAVGSHHTWGLARVAPLDSVWIDLIGLLVGLVGLWMCHHAQSTMGANWRVGIDVEAPTSLVTSGAFRYVRNPTYTGLFLLMGGLWLVWPTPLVTLFIMLFVLTIEVQVRVEEEHLHALHGHEYGEYLTHTGRYLPRWKKRQ
jgi:protein-S-isoprenylcysteine O-methyltransferase Ste14